RDDHGVAPASVPQPRNLFDVVVLRSPPGMERDTGQAATELAAEVGSMVSGTNAHRGPPSGLVLVGGDTSARVLAALRVVALDVLGEVEVGMPVVELRGGPWDGVRAITTAGGFGG